jgi:hypothetical protein
MIKGILKILALPVVFIVMVVMNASGDGIYPLSRNAVYLAGEGCYLNNELSRGLRDMELDFEECLKMHSAHQFHMNFKGYPDFEW